MALISSTGFSHVRLTVIDISRSKAAALADAGIEHGDVVDLGDAGIAILSFQDPDDINVELTAPLA